MVRIYGDITKIIGDTPPATQALRRHSASGGEAR